MDEFEDKATFAIGNFDNISNPEYDTGYVPTILLFDNGKLVTKFAGNDCALALLLQCTVASMTTALWDVLNRHAHPTLAAQTARSSSSSVERSSARHPRTRRTSAI